ncbi:MAG: hypothetical protein A3H37_09115 [Candidatus Schekmanbacteria bacterium RIFCSPLOWO2_02_FULL_38_14]|uniref:Amine oxidase domain-containing protein n=1 Tax=Candidatus Schekmanbacteria bacterium RIFCSPLOWO2_12_FULL_38_15 TaxID=1817883 RepID=A0A1F7SLE8_9BACT|nr:MAG: hypothetical protein A3H37_09115 [Candidatus Schekmanbacteria bacterium RIFCSPLOWO2_02_FULL_38_14]OGL54612.1 MAG: hypothetical protein A3G31_12080 [Candidatus Schekmanbacteria bacterium RIFCSPLOWO2_12_FULL_38_15]
MNKDKKVIILGAGLAGLSSAWKLSEAGYDVEVIDKKPEVGGLSGTLNYKGFLFDYGGHRFITKNHEVLKEIKKLLGNDFWLNHRKTQYFLWHKYLNYPLELKDMLLKVNPLISTKAMLDYFWTVLNNKIKPVKEESFEDWVVNRFGRTLYLTFFGQYTEKVWGISPKKIDKEWASQRISLLNLMDVLKKLIFKPRNQPRTYTTEYYYCTDGIGQIASKMAEAIIKNGGKIHLNSEVSRLEQNGKLITRVYFEKDGVEHQTNADWVLSTIPVNSFVLYLKPGVPPEIKESANHLRFRSIMFLNLLINKDLVTENDALYIPEPKYFFFRIEQFKLWSAKMAPANKTSLSLEISCFDGDEIWNEKPEIIYDKCLSGLKEMGLINGEGLIEDYFIVKEKEVYPVFEIGYKENINAIRNYLDNFENLICYGRQGNFQYIHMHHVVDMGFRVAKFFEGKFKKDEITKVGTDNEYFG